MANEDRPENYNWKLDGYTIVPGELSNAQVNASFTYVQQSGFTAEQELRIRQIIAEEISLVLDGVSSKIDELRAARNGRD